MVVFNTFCHNLFVQRQVVYLWRNCKVWFCLGGVMRVIGRLLLAHYEDKMTFNLQCRVCHKDETIHTNGNSLGFESELFACGLPKFKRQPLLWHQWHLRSPAMWLRHSHDWLHRFKAATPAYVSNFKLLLCICGVIHISLNLQFIKLGFMNIHRMQNCCAADTQRIIVWMQ